jgi:predicted transcriptional regulator
LIVKGEPAKQRILSALSDEYSRRILTATVDQPLDALELSKNFDIPVTTVYRRIQDLLDAGLIVRIKSDRANQGRWYDLYQSLLLRIDVSFEHGETKIDATLNDQISDEFTRMWARIMSAT